jgi:hypothetical protein
VNVNDELWDLKQIATSAGMSWVVVAKGLSASSIHDLLERRALPVSGRKVCAARRSGTQDPWEPIHQIPQLVPQSVCEGWEFVPQLYGRKTK